jgi:hypothetical protein
MVMTRASQDKSRVDGEGLKKASPATPNFIAT